MHVALYTLLGLALLTNLICLAGIFHVKGIYRDNSRVFAVAKWVEFLGITLVVHLLLVLVLLVYALLAAKFGVATFFLVFLLSPFAIGLAADEYRTADRYIVLQLWMLLLSLILTPVLFTRLL